MKNIIALALLSAFFFGCSPTKLKPTKRVMLIDVFDFREYSESGFFISRGEYKFGVYDPVGEISIYVVPAKTLKEEVVEYEIGVLIGKNRIGYETKTKLVTEKISREELLKMLADKARELGADAIVNLLFTEGSQRIAKGLWTSETDSYFTVSGFAIKRK